MKIVGYTLKHGKLIPPDDKMEAISKLGTRGITEI